MTDPIDTTEFGLGAIQSPADARDWPISQAYLLAALEPVAAPPAAFLAPTPYPPVYNQMALPQCVAYSNGGSKVYQDLRDTGLFAPNQSLFFSQIGGTANGAVPRVALNQMLTAGYPPVSGAATDHRIAAFYAVPVAAIDIQSAIMSFGPVLLVTPWYNSWFRPVNGVLPAPDTQVGSHEFYVLGWDARGLRCRNSWGSLWGLGGDFILPWSMLHLAYEAWKSVDAIVVVPVTWRIHIPAGSTVQVATVTPDDKISGWTSRKVVTMFDGPCTPPDKKLGTHSGSAMVVRPLKRPLAGLWIKWAPPVTLTHS